MKILESITSRYKKIAAGIAIVSFLAIMYLALIPGGSMAHVYGPDGGILSGVFVFIKEWPQYNTTSAFDGTYTINNMPIGEYTLVAMGNDSYAPNITNINVTTGTNTKDVTLKAAIKYYVPFLYQRQDHIGYDYNAAVQIQNNGTVNASIEIPYYNLGGTIAGNEVFLLEPGKLMNASPYKYVGPVTYIGPIVVKSNVPVQVQGYINTVSGDIYSIGPSFIETSTTAYIPFLYQRTDHIGYDYDSGVQVFNPSSSSSTNVTIKLYNLAGTLVGNNTYLVGPKAEIIPKVAEMLPGQTIYIGPAEIISEQPIVAQGYIRTTSSLIYSIAPSLTATVTTAYIPFMYQRTDHIGFDYDSGVQVFNPSSTSSTNVTIKLYNTTGTLVANNTYLVGPKAETIPKVAEMLPGQTIYIGPAEIISEQPIVAQGYIRTTNSKIYSVAPQVRKPGSVIDVHIPFLYSTASNSHDAGFQVMNPNSAQADINISLYYKDGTLAGSYVRILNAYEEVVPKVFDVAPNTVDFDGYVIIKANQSIISQGFIRNKITNIYSIAPPVER